ncbi:hypothetical protein [Serpentinicella alkaliphila]|uniref:Uncharacterized protein n=1 Tax=Serpentinicella alkaliphila TaxID=1734049 RepID=A0A4R2THD4_9FIRM|nr:hypothetical protein [Serpentinicella alkaliphila]QUH25986.1 hypothetical protein HZR23_09745 [Serpentinicella alkaliphila]TCQ02156.1 hypothetical protein EDD79_101836 [Serpentinicella alkaliphila]
MSVKSFITNLLKNAVPQSDYIQVKLEDLYIEMKRITDPGIPHEVTVVVPRAEIRERYNEQGELIEKEIILNSITVVHAPRHPLAGPPSSSIEPPEIPARGNKNFKPK